MLSRASRALEAALSIAEEEDYPRRNEESLKNALDTLSAAFGAIADNVSDLLGREASMMGEVVKWMADAATIPFCQEGFSADDGRLTERVRPS